MIGDPGQQQFRDLIPQCRNHDIAAGLQPLMLLRREVVHSEDIRDPGGLDDASRDHFVQLLANADRWRRRVTHNPEDADLGVLIAEAIDAESDIADAQKPFAGDDIQMGATNLYDLPWDFSGGDPKIPLFSSLDLSGNGRIFLSAIDMAIKAWTRLNSRERSHYITRFDSLRIYGLYQRMYAYLITFGGDDHRVDVAQLDASREPRGPENAPNRVTETTGRSA